jgi:hypothetical protein
METLSREGIQVSLGEAQILNLSLVPAGQLLTTVVVHGKRVVRANQYGSGVNISGTQLAMMPTIMRSITDMTRLTPQASKDNSFGGSNFRYNNWFQPIPGWYYRCIGHAWQQHPQQPHLSGCHS